MSENSVPETAISEKDLHDLAMGNLTAAMAHHTVDVARRTLPFVLRKMLTGQADMDEAMKTIQDFAETVTILQDLVVLLEEHAGLTKERIDELQAYGHDRVAEAFDSDPYYKSLIARAIEAQTSTSTEKLEKAMGSTDPEVIFRNMGPGGFQL